MAVGGAGGRRLRLLLLPGLLPGLLLDAADRGADLHGRARLRQDLQQHPAAGRLEPTVVVRPEASNTATVMEVRMDDRPGVVHLVCAALADLELSVRSAHVSTLGPQAVDVFYVQESGAGALSEERAAQAAHAVREALRRTVTLDQ